jgi:hypothetical protein
MRNRFLCGLSLCLCVLVLTAQTHKPSERAIRDLADFAPVAPPELAADVLLKLIERGHIVDPKWKREALETAWSLAPRATYPFEIEPAVETASESDPGSLSAALAMGLSTAGIQARIIAQMVKLDPRETRNMFLQMSPPSPESPSCSADRYTSHRAYFQSLKVAAQTFSAEETGRGEKARFLAEGLRFISNPEDFELSGGFSWLDQRLTDEEFAQVGASWAEMLSRLHFSDRLFSSRSIEAITTPLLYGDKRALRGASPAGVFRAFRSYFVNHARAARCEESRSKAAEEERIRVAFNKLIATTIPGIPAITAEEIRPENFGGSAKVVRFISGNERVRQMKLEISRLRSGSGEQKEYLTVEQRSTPEWNEEALRFLNKLEGWSRDFGQSNREIFFQKAELHSALVYAAPEGELRRSLLDSYVKFLASSPVERESPPEWAAWVSRLIGAAEIPDRAAWLDQIERAGNPAIAVYCQLARLRLQ